jgi:hypothetical protein
MYIVLQGDGRGKRRTVADALEVVRQALGVNEVARTNQARSLPAALGRMYGRRGSPLP